MLKVAVAAAIAAVLVMSLTGKASARDDGRFAQSEHRDFFRSLTDQEGRGCCDGADGMRLEDPDWEIKDGSYRVRLNGEWIDVEPEQVVRQGNKVGFAVVWPWTDNAGVVRIRCFMPGSGA